MASSTIGWEEVEEVEEKAIEEEMDEMELVKDDVVKEVVEAAGIEQLTCVIGRIT